MQFGDWFPAEALSSTAVIGPNMENFSENSEMTLIE